MECILLFLSKIGSGIQDFKIKGGQNPKIDFSSFERLGMVEQLYEIFLSC